MQLLTINTNTCGKYTLTVPYRSVCNDSYVQLLGQAAEKKLDKAEVASSVADSTKQADSQKSLKEATKSTAGTEVRSIKEG